MLELVKSKLGISSQVRDDVLNSIIGGVEKDFSNIYKLDINEYQDLASDIVCYLYRTKGEKEYLSKNLYLRIREAQYGAILKSDS